jgi:hypothetical protein
MPVQLTETTDQIALEAAFQLHREMLSGDGFYGYDGSIDAFQALAQECLFILENDDYEAMYVGLIVDQFYANQLEVGNGEREACYWMA